MKAPKEEKDGQFPPLKILPETCGLSLDQKHGKGRYVGQKVCKNYYSKHHVEIQSYVWSSASFAPFLSCLCFPYVVSIRRNCIDGVKRVGREIRGIL